MRALLAALVASCLLAIPSALPARAAEPDAGLEAGRLVALGAAVVWPEDCRPEAMPPDAMSLLPLGHGAGGDRLLLATCALHAYQASYRAWRVRETAGGGLEAVPLLFPQLLPQDGGDGPGARTLAWRADLAGLAELDGARLTLVTKARGLGDCGEVASWDLSQPLPVAVAYRSRPDCPEAPEAADADWRRWPALDGAWLRERRPADRSWAAARALAALHAGAPDLAWLAAGLVESDATCSGQRETWALGLDPLAQPPALSLRSTGGQALGPIPVDSGQQVALCGLDARLSLESPGRCPARGPTLAIDDGLCDRLRLTWDPTSGDWLAGRN